MRSDEEFDAMLKEALEKFSNELQSWMWTGFALFTLGFIAGAAFVWAAFLSR